jgi:hypothetical protein
MTANAAKRLAKNSKNSAPAHQLSRAFKSSALSAADADSSLDFPGTQSGGPGAFARRPARLGPEFYPFWPRRMNAEMAAAYCGEASTRAFLARVGPNKEFPLPRVREGRRVLWLKDDLDKAISPEGGEAERDVAKDL